MFSFPSTESETLNDIVLDLTGVDLTEIRKEDLSINKNYEERSVSAMSVASTESSEKPVRFFVLLLSSKVSSRIQLNEDNEDMVGLLK